MLTIDECRRLLGNPDWSDEQVVEIRDALQAFASLCIDEYLRERQQAKRPQLQ
jgi:hypothetical protein